MIEKGHALVLVTKHRQKNYIAMTKSRAEASLKSKGYFSLNDFNAWAACNWQNSKE